MERFNLKKLNDVEVKEQYQVKISNKFVALWKTWMMKWTSKGGGEVLEII
jgi:hypothetical protein